MVFADTDGQPADVSRHYRLAGALMVVWALKWFSGPVVFALQADQVSRMVGASYFGPAAVYFRHGANLVGLAIAVASIVVGIRLRKLRPHAPEQARWVLLGIIAYQALLVMGPALLELVLARANATAVLHTGPIALLVCGAALPDLLCAGGLIWFLAQADRPVPADGEQTKRSPVPPVITLAILVLLAREGLRVALAPADVYALQSTLAAGFDAPVYAVVIAIGVLTALGAIALGLARITGARSLGPATMVVLLLVLARLLVSFGLPSVSGLPPGAAGAAMMAGLGLSSIANVAEYGMLLFAVESFVRRSAA